MDSQLGNMYTDARELNFCVPTFICYPTLKKGGNLFCQCLYRVTWFNMQHRKNERELHAEMNELHYKGKKEVERHSKILIIFSAGLYEC